MRPSAPIRGFTLIELMVSMSLGTVVMLAVFSTYNYLGRNLTRLSYRNILESQSRRILTTLAADTQNAKSVIDASSTRLTLNVYNAIAARGPTPLMKVIYDFNGADFTRTLSKPDGTEAKTLSLNYQITTSGLAVPVLIQDLSFLHYTTTGGNPVSQFDSTISAPMSVKQISLNFTLQAGSSTQTQQGLLTTYPVASGRMPLVSRQFPDGS